MIGCCTAILTIIPFENGGVLLKKWRKPGQGQFFFLKVTGRGENPPPEFHSLALEWPIKWVKKFYSILILWLHCGFKGSTPGHANSKITMR